MEGEQDSEMAQLQQEKDALERLKEKMADIENKAQMEKSQVCAMIKSVYQREYLTIPGDATNLTQMCSPKLSVLLVCTVVQ